MYRLFDERRYLIPFRATLLPQMFTDVLVIGGGVAGFTSALSAADELDVIVAGKGRLKQSNTYWAQGGISVVADPADTFESHIEDTVKAGAGLCDMAAVEVAVKQAPEMVKKLVAWGMSPDPKSDLEGTVTVELNQFALGREGRHSFPRIIHAHGDATGRAVAETLQDAAVKHENIRIFEDCFVLDLITVEGQPPRCVGAITHHPKYGLQVIWAKSTILAAGGCGQIYRESTNPGVSTGDGLAMAYRAGATVADMGFMQFHPTTLYVAGASRSLITEAVRGEGAKLVDRNDFAFMKDYHELADLAPRDIVSRAIISQMHKTDHSHAYLDCRDMDPDQFASRFPGIFRLLNDFGINPATDPIPIHPSAHYMVGGVLTDTQGRTSINSLLACGEVACTGLHGANRLASNSLLEGLVYGDICGRQVISDQREAAGEGAHPKIISDIRISGRSELDVNDVRSSLRSVMWRHVGIERSGSHLQEVQQMFDFWARYTLDKIFDDRQGWEVQNMLLVGDLITRSARMREESRGTHYREDFPELNPGSGVHDLWQRGHSEPRWSEKLSENLADFQIPESISSN